LPAAGALRPADAVLTDFEDDDPPEIGRGCWLEPGWVAEESLFDRVVLRELSAGGGGGLTRLVDAVACGFNAPG
jgi:hypothetical protein